MCAFAWTKNSSGWSIVLNVVGGVLTIAVSWLFRDGLQRWHRRRFKTIFGSGLEPYILVHGRLISRAQQGENKFVFTTEEETPFSFSAKHVASACEIRAASYLASALGKDGHRFSAFADAQSVKDKLDMDFISFGAMSNGKTIDIFENEANDLATFDTTKMLFVSKKNGQPLYAFRPDRDYGVILKIHPIQFPARTWMACAGLGETGTSGSAWYLAHKWRELEERIRGQHQFVAVIELKPDEDESAILRVLSLPAKV